MTPVLEARALVFRYPGGFSIGPVELRLGPGVHLLRGANGAGKTTLMQCLCGALRPLEGRVSVCGEDPVRQVRARRRVGYLPGTPDLPDFLTVDECWQQLAALRGSARWDGSELREALELPGGLLLRHASTGQRRKAELLAALAGDPPVLLLDEPLASLDADAEALVARWIGAWGQARVVLVASHGPVAFQVDSEHRLTPGSPLRLLHPS